MKKLSKQQKEKLIALAKREITEWFKVLQDLEKLPNNVVVEKCK